jgi:hypothetical protein
MWEQICAARANKSPYYSDQRTNPHHLVPERKTEFFFDKADARDPLVSRLQRYTAVTSVTNLLQEVEETMQYVKMHSGDELDCDQKEIEIAEEASDNNDVAMNDAYAIPSPDKYRDKIIHDIAPW